MLFDAPLESMSRHVSLQPAISAVASARASGPATADATRQVGQAIEPSIKLRVLFLASRDIRHPANTGGDIGLWERAQYLVSVGHDVTFMASAFDGAMHRETIDGIKVVRIGGLLSEAPDPVPADVVVVEGFGGSRIPRLTPIYVK